MSSVYLCINVIMELHRVYHTTLLRSDCVAVKVALTLKLSLEIFRFCWLRCGTSFLYQNVI